jgi:hypothetical protein
VCDVPIITTKSNEIYIKINTVNSLSLSPSIMYNTTTKEKNDVTAMLHCPFAHHHIIQNRHSTHSNAEVTNGSLRRFGPVPAPAPPPPAAATTTNQLASLLDDTCPLDSNAQTIHDEIMPPEHEELKKGYAGKTCPFLESTGLGDHDEEGDEDVNQDEIEMKGHDGSLFHPTAIGSPFGHDKLLVLGQQQQLHHGREEAMNHCPFHRISSSSSSGGGGGLSLNGPKETIQNLQSSTATNILDISPMTKNSKSNLLSSSQPLPPQPPPPQTAAQARRQMDDILSEQKKAQEAIHQCQQRLIQAQQDLDRAMMQKSALDQMAMESAEAWTDLLLQDGDSNNNNHKKNSKWNEMYRKLEEYKAQHGHCDVKRQLTKREKEMDPDLAALSQWVGKIRNEGRKAESDSERMMEPYKVVALNRLGFDWAPRDNAWMQNYERVKVYLEKNPGRLPQRRKSELGVWANGQIIEYNKFMAGNSKAYITQHKIDLLNKINFPWDRMQNTWMERYQALKEFHSKYGHCRVTKTNEDQVLYRWVTKERMKYRNYLAGEKPCQTSEQWKLLEKLDFMEGNKIPVVAKKRKLDVDASSELDGMFCPKRLVSDCDSTSV